MMTAESVPSLIEALRATRLLTPEQFEALAPLTAEGRRVSAQFLAADLVRRGWLTEFQANQLLEGRGAYLWVGDYLLLEPLGEGGSGQVFKARHATMRRLAAVKLIRRDMVNGSRTMERFYREIEALGRLRHPNIIEAYGAGESGLVHFFAMEYLEGDDLKHYVTEKGPLPVEKACDCVRQAALGLQHAFENDLVHRDVKPSNLFLTNRGLIKVLDLGLVSMDGHDGGTLTATGDVMGTPDFMAPEQAEDAHQVDIRADVYSLGATLYFLLTGRTPLPDGSIYKKLLWIQTREPDPIIGIRAEVPVGLADLVMRMMSKKPDGRPATPGEVANLLQPYTGIAAVPALSPMPNPAAAPVAPVVPVPAPAGKPSWSFLTPVSGQTAAQTIERKAPDDRTCSTTEAAPQPADLFPLTARAGERQVELSWDAQPKAICYAVYRGPRPGWESAVLYRTGVVETTFQDDKVTDGTTYHYQVVAITPGGPKRRSVEVAIAFGKSAPPPADLPLSQGSTLQIDDRASQTVRPGPDISPFELEPEPPKKKPTALPPEEMPSEISRSNQGIRARPPKPGRLSSFEIVWSPPTGNPPVAPDVFSPEAAALPPPPPPPEPVAEEAPPPPPEPAPAAPRKTDSSPRSPVRAPTAPTDLTASSGNARVALRWKSVVGAHCYSIYRTGTATQTATAPHVAGVTGTSFTDEGVMVGRRYFYQVSAVFSATGEGPRSAKIAAQVTLAAPAEVFAQSGNCQVRVSWLPVEGAALYTVLRKAPNDHFPKPIKVGLAATNFTDTAVTNGNSYAYSVQAMSMDGGQSTASVAASATPQVYRRIVAISAGSALSTDHYGADAGYRGGSAYTSRDAVDIANLVNAAPRRVYQSERTGAFGYTILDLPPKALFLIRLHFAELTFDGPGKRVFNVSVNRAPVLENFDIVAAAGGKNKAIIREMIAQSSSDGMIDVIFKGVTGQAKVSALELLQVSSSVNSYRFNDTTGNSTPLTGTHEGIDFGKTEWRSRSGGTTASREGHFADASKTSASFGLPEGATLTGLVLSSSSHGTYQINDGTHPVLKGKLDPMQPVRVRTGWTKPGARIGLSLSNGWEAAVTEIEWAQFER
jgi:serine/threonine-protein kinase